VSAVADPIVVCARTTPEFGMESVVHRVLQLLNERQRVEAVVATGPAWDDVPMTSLGGRVTGLLRLAVIWARLLRSRQTFRDRVVVLAGVWTALAFLAVPRTGARSVIVWEHTLIPDKIRTSRKLQLLAAVAGVLYRRASVVVCVSEPLAASVRRLTRHRSVTVVHNPLPAEPFAADELAGRGLATVRRLATVGALTGTKNQAEVIRALPSLPAVDLTVVGGGPSRAELVRLCDDLGVADRVDFLGHVPREKVDAVLRDADVVVHPSKGETFGMVYFEAAQAGVPVVAASNTLSEWCVPAYVPGVTYANGVAGLVAALARVADAVTAEAVAAAYRRRVDDFDAGRIVAAWSDLLATASGDAA
jgi:glycosyltransferase involved in cell wall biosynthesis